MICKKIDGVGRVVIPVEVRSALNWKEGDMLSLEIEDNVLLLRKNEPNKCKLCGNQYNLHKVKDYYLCENCIEYINNTL